MDDLYQQWLAAKEEEKAAVEKRRKIEDWIMAHLRVDPAVEGTIRVETQAVKGAITTRHTRKVDSDLLQDLAAEHGLTDHLSTLFRWKPEINMSAWKRADESITRPLAKAITSTAGRPSFKLEIVEQ